MWREKYYSSMKGTVSVAFICTRHSTYHYSAYYLEIKKSRNVCVERLW